MIHKRQVMPSKNHCAFQGSHVNRRGFFIGTGTLLLVIGLTGLALLQTSMFDTLVGRGAREQLEFPQPGPSGQVPGPSGQSRLEGKIPAPSSRQTTPAPQAGPPQAAMPQPGAPADNLASQPGGRPTEVSPRPDETLPRDGTGTEPYTQIPPVLKGERRYPGQTEISPPTKSTPGTGSRTGPNVAESGRGDHISRQNIPESRQPVTIRFAFDPEHGRDVKVARVHFGDRVVIKVRRFGPGDRQIYLGFDLPERNSERSRYYGRKVRKTHSVITPVNDSDQLTINSEELFGPSLTGSLDSKEGAILKLGAKHPGRQQRFANGNYQGGNERCEVEIRIYSGNRWNLRPRSLL